MPLDAYRICINCMRRHDGEGKCPNCGFDPASYKAPAHHLPPNTVLNGRFIVCRAIGEGGFGITYIGYNPDLEMRVAIKEYFPRGFVSRDSAYTKSVLPFSGASEKFFEKGRLKFIEEGRALARFDNDPGIVTVKDYFEENGTAYIVMEYISGMNLGAYVEKNGGKIDMRRAYSMLLQPMLSLEKIHKMRLVHRDISPENIMVSEDGSVKLIDFGAAKTLLNNSGASTEILLRPGFAPEEQYRTSGKQDSWTDIYALCATIYKAITGVTPPEAPDRLVKDELIAPSKLGAKIEPRCEKALMKGLSVFAKNRQQTVRELMDELRPRLAEDPAPKKRPWKLLAASAALLLALIACWFLFFAPKPLEFSSPALESLVCEALGAEKLYARDLEGVESLTITPEYVSLRSVAAEYSGEEELELPLDDLAHFPNLRRLRITDVKIADAAALSRLTNIEELTLENCDIDDIGFVTALPNLRRLTLRKQPRLTDTTPLVGLELEYLEVTDCGVTGVTFADAEFERLFRAAMGKETGEITREELEGVTGIHISPEGMEFTWDGYGYTGEDYIDISLADIALFPNITNLYVEHAHMTRLDAVAACPRLDCVTFISTDITDIGFLSGIGTLRKVFLYSCPVADISALAGMNLQYVSLNGTNVTDISALAGMDGLTTLYISNTGISDISPLADCTALEVLLAENTRITDWSPVKHVANVTGRPEVIFADAEFERLFRAAIGKETGEITRAELEGVTVIHITPDGMSFVWDGSYTGEEYFEISLADIALFPNLTQLNIERARVTNPEAVAACPKLDCVAFISTDIADISFLSDIGTLRAVYLYNSPVADISALAGRNLQKVGLSGTNVTDISALAGMTDMTGLYIGNTGISDISPLSGCVSLAEMYAENTRITDWSPVKHVANVTGRPEVIFADAEFERLFRAAIGKETGEIARAELEGVTTIHITPDGMSFTWDDGYTGEEYCEISLADIALFPNLTKLNIERASVTNAEAVAGCSQLDVVVFLGTDITDIGFLRDIGTLRAVFLYNSPVADISALAGNNLQYIGLSGTNVTDISALAGMTDLLGLFISDTGISDISALAGCISLEEIRAENTQITDWSPVFDVSTVTGSPYAWFTDRALEAKLARALNIDGRIPADRLSGIESLMLYGGSAMFKWPEYERDPLPEVGGSVDLADIRWLPGLQNLCINGAELLNIDALADTRLVNLRLFNCGLTDCEFARNIPALQKLYLDGNSIASLAPLSELGVICLGFAGNPIESLAPLENIESLVFLDVAGCALPESDWAFVSRLDEVRGFGTKFSDPEFERLLRAALGNETGAISAETLSGITELTITPRGLVFGWGDPDYDKQGRISLDMTDVALFPNLIGLNVENVDMTNAEAAARCPKLRSVVFSGTELSDIGFMSDFAALENVFLYGNPVSDITPLGGLDIHILGLDSTQVTDISLLADMSDLQALYINDTAIADISPLAGLENLAVVDAVNTEITDWSPIDGVPNVTGRPEVVFEDPEFERLVRVALGNETGEISAETLAAITEMTVTPDGITFGWNGDDYTGDDYIDISLADLRLFPNLTALYVRNARLTGVEAAANCPKLANVAFLRTDLSDIGFMSGLTRLVTVYLHHSPVADVSALSGKGIMVLGLTDTSVEDLSPLAEMPALERIYVSDIAVSDLSPLAGLEKLAELEAENTQVTDWSPVFGVARVTGSPYAWFADRALEAGLRSALGASEERLTLEELRGVESLAIIGGDVLLEAPDKYYIVQNAPEVALDASELRYLPNLAALTVTDRELLNPDALSGIAPLASLTLCGNGLTDCGFAAGLPNLRRLEIWANPITNLSPLTGLELTALDIDGTLVASLAPISGMTSLESLSINSCRVTDIEPLKGLSLKWLYMSNNDVASLKPLSGMSGLAWLYADNCRITDVSPLEYLDALEYVSLAGNSITDWSPLSRAAYVEGRPAGENWDDNFHDMLCRAGADKGWYIGYIFTDEELSRITVLSVSPEGISFERPGEFQPGNSRDILINIADISRMTGLEELYIRDVDVVGFSTIASLPNLQSLSLDNCGLMTCDFIAPMTTLKKLSLCGNPLFEDITPLANLSIVNLNISWSAVRSLAPLSGMERLISLTAVGCPITDWSPVEGVPTVTR